MTANWLDRRISAPGPYLCLCLTEQEYDAAIADLSIKRPGPWLKHEHADATAHHCTNPDGGLAVVVCLGAHVGRNAVEIAGLLVHEAVHAWQEWCERYGETNPGREQEAYGIQSISQELLAEYARRLDAGFVPQ